MFMQVCKRMIRSFFQIFFSLLSLIMVTLVFVPVVPVAQAAGGQLMISGQTTGHAGTAFHVDASGLAPDGTYNLYATTDSAKCTLGDPGTLGLQVFTPSTLTIAGGSASQDLKWPDQLAQAGQYFLCLVNSAALNGPKTVSTNSFTVAAAVTLNVAPGSVTAGQSVTITGTNWLPVQALDVSVVVGNSAALVENNTVQPDSTGNFSVALTIPDNATPGTYAIRAYALNEQTLKLVKNDALTVTAKATPTPTPQASPTATPTIVAATPTPTTAASSEPGGSSTNPPSMNSDNTTLNLVIFGMAGLGILFVLIGAVMFAVSAQSENG